VAGSPLITHHSLKHAPKIFTETCKIDFTKTVEEVHNLIRGLSPFPGAYTFLDGKMLKIFRSEKNWDGSGRDALSGLNQNINNGQSTQSAPAINTDGKTFLKFACANGYIIVKELQLEGKKKMNVEDFLRGYRFTA
jgi:methionyl-tRNA formyltransferase